MTSLFVVTCHAWISSEDMTEIMVRSYSVKAKFLTGFPFGLN